MAVNLPIPADSDIFPVNGVEIGVAQAGIRYANRHDLTVFRLAPGSQVAGVFTRNRFCAAPVQLCQRHLAVANAHAPIGALVINTGNANAGTGATGLAHAEETCAALSDLLGLRAQQVLPFSTGVIMEPLPVARLIAALPAAIADLRKNHWSRAAFGIMTTDTQPKIHSQRVSVGGHTVTITGISKGAGMIRPNMATMLGFLATDAAIAPALLTRLTHELAEQSFNRISIDGDTSTNDSFILIATGQSGVSVQSEADSHYAQLRTALAAAALDLAQKIVRDAEGATKFITVRIEEAASKEEALQVAYAIAHSPLVKTAFYAADPNLGRILAAIGYAGINNLEVDRIRLWLDDVLVSAHGGRHPDYTEADGQRIMQQPEITVRVALARGLVTETVYTCDLSHEYVTINADYRS